MLQGDRTHDRSLCIVSLRRKPPLHSRFCPPTQTAAGVLFRSRARATRSECGNSAMGTVICSHSIQRPDPGSAPGCPTGGWALVLSFPKPWPWGRSRWSSYTAQGAQALHQLRAWGGGLGLRWCGPSTQDARIRGKGSINVAAQPPEEVPPFGPARCRSSGTESLRIDRRIARILYRTAYARLAAVALGQLLWPPCASEASTPLGSCLVALQMSDHDDHGHDVHVSLAYAGYP